MYLSEINREAPRLLRANYVLARRAPSVMKLMFRLFWWFSRRDPEAFIKMGLKQAPQADQGILSRPDVYAVGVETWQENIRVDSRGYAQDVEILMKDWGFRLRDIQAEVCLWQGEADINTPSAWAWYLAQEIPGCRATFFPNEGHFALFTHWGEIFQTLAGD
jgi:pimeloyl-ACP methyl ester carboxylesterase